MGQTMPAKPLRIVSLCIFTSLVLAGDGPKECLTGRNVRTVKVIAQVPGVIEYLGAVKKPLAVGDRVMKGQVLVQFDGIQADMRAKIEWLRKQVDPEHVKAAQLLATESERRMTTVIRLFEVGAAARAEKDAAILTYHKYRDEAAALQRLLGRAQAGPKGGPTPLERAKLAVDMHCLKSPFNGVVRAIYKTRGEGVKASEAILLIEEVRE